MTQKSAIIIGAGYGGMALANLLGKAGYRVTVCEKNQAAGGRIHAVQHDGYVFDLGPSWYLMPEIFEQYYALFGESAATRLELMRFSPGYKVFFEDNTSLQVQGNVDEDKQTFETIEAGAGEALSRYVARSSRVYELSVKYFLYNNFLRISDMLRWPILKNIPTMVPLVAQSLHAYVSKHFRTQRLQQLLEYHMVFLGSSPFQAPAVYTLMSHLDFKSGIYYPKRGMLSLATDMRALGDRYDVAYRHGSAVAEIIVEQGSAVGVRLENGDELRADVVVSNADLHHTETKLLAAPHRTYSARYWARRQPGPGALLVSLGVNKPLPQLQHHNLYFVDEWRENFRDIYEAKKIPEHASIYVCNPSKTDPTLAPDGKENLFILVPIPAGVSISREEQSKLAERVIRQFGMACGEPNLAQSIETMHMFGPDEFGDRYNAWQENAFGGESHLLGQSIFFRTNNASKRVKNLFYVGAGTLPGIGLPMCLIGAQLTYKRIVGDRSAGPLERGVET